MEEGGERRAASDGAGGQGRGAQLLGRRQSLVNENNFQLENYLK